MGWDGILSASSGLCLQLEGSNNPYIRIVGKSEAHRRLKKGIISGWCWTVRVRALKWNLIGPTPVNHRALCADLPHKVLRKEWANGGPEVTHPWALASRIHASGLATKSSLERSLRSLIS